MAGVIVIIAIVGAGVIVIVAIVAVGAKREALELPKRVQEGSKTAPRGLRRA